MQHTIRYGDGAVAAGHPETAAVGAGVLAAGGNAADAACAMVLAACVCEGTLTSLGGGGFFLVGGTGVERPVLFDAFVRHPGLGPARRLAPWQRFDLELSGTTLSFGTGPAAVAVPLMSAGLGAVSERFGRWDLARCSQPAAELAQEGVVLTALQAGEQLLNLGMLRRDPEGAAIFVDPATDTARRPGELFRQVNLAATIEEVGATHGRTFVDGGMAHRLLAWSEERGGRIAREDLAAATVVAVDPIEARIGDGLLLANPAPAYGGRILAMLAERILSGHAADPGHVARCVTDVIGGVEAPKTFPPDHGEAVVPPVLHDVDPLTIQRGAFAHSPNTTHVVAVDADGMFASATTTVGYGSGEYLPGTGVQLNNVLAEYDHTLPRAAGARIPSMMTPGAWRDGERLVVIGSAGSDRIPQAISQVLARLCTTAPDLETAIRAPRFVFDGVTLHMEPGLDPSVAGRMPGLHAHNPWEAIDGYFGTTNAVMATDAGMEAVGDPRRSCCGIVL